MLDPLQILAQSQKVAYQGIYPGTDLVYYGNQRQLEYDFVVAPGFDPRNIQLQIDGATKLKLDPDGNLVLHTHGGAVLLHTPEIYQDINGKRQSIAGGWRLGKRHEVGFHIAAYDRTKSLVIDPVLVYSTYLGGSAPCCTGDRGNGVAVDSSGDAYVTGLTTSDNFPTLDPFQSSRAGGQDVFVTKFAPSGSSLIYSTYIGGSGDDSAQAVALDAAGNAYVAGATTSTDYPTANPYQPSSGCGTPGCFTAFVTKLNEAGDALVYSTYLGGSVFDFASGIAVDASGNAYVTGSTKSNDFPLQDPFQSECGGCAGGSTTAFVTKFNADGSALVYSTYLGGTAQDTGRSIALDASGNAYVTGDTTSNDFPTANAFQPYCANDCAGGDAFITKFNESGSELVYSTYLGGSDADAAYGIAVDASGSASVAGPTASHDFPLVNALFANFGSSFVAKFNASGDQLVYSTYLAGATATGVAVDSLGDTYVTGYTGGGIPVTPNAWQKNCSILRDIFVTAFNADGSGLIYSSPLGCEAVSQGASVAVNSAGEAFVTGFVFDIGFPVVNPFQSFRKGIPNAFLTKISCGDPDVCAALGNQTNQQTKSPGIRAH